MKHKLSLFVLVFFFLFCSNIAEAKEQVIVIERINQTLQLTSTLKATDLVEVQPGQILKDEPVTIKNRLKENIVLSCETSVVINDVEFNSGYDAFFETSSSTSTGSGNLVKQLKIAPNQTIEVNAVSILNGEKLGNGTQGKIGKLKWIFEVKENIDFSSDDSSQMSSSNNMGSSSTSISIDNEVVDSKDCNELLGNSNDLGSYIDESTEKKILPKTGEEQNSLSIISFFYMIFIGIIFSRHTKKL